VAGTLDPAIIALGLIFARGTRFGQGHFLDARNDDPISRYHDEERDLSLLWSALP
jgi:hypothetical protein